MINKGSSGKELWFLIVNEELVSRKRIQNKRQILGEIINAQFDRLSLKQQEDIQEEDFSESSPSQRDLGCIILGPLF